MRMKSRARKALGEGIRHIVRAGAFEECDVTRVDTIVQEMTLDADVTRAITIHGGFTHRDARGIVFPHFSRKRNTASSERK